MNLTMIKLEPDMGRLIRWAERRDLLAPRQDDDLGYALHALLAATFDAAAPKPFALRREPGKPPVLLGYAEASGDALRTQAQSFAEPDAAEAIGLDSFAAKAMPEVWEPGCRLGFTVRVRPMVRADRDGDRARTREVDAFVLSPPGSERGAVYARWLGAHLPGTTLDRTTLEAFTLSAVRRRGRPEGDDGKRPLRSQRGPDATFSGQITVTDGPAFAAALARGIGRHRAFGFGMLLLRPAR